MTHDEYTKLCERFEVEVELERMALTKNLQDQRGPILYMGSTRLRNQLRAEWEETQRKELAEELEYRTKRSELEFFGVDGREGAKAKIKEKKPDSRFVSFKKWMKNGLHKMTQLIAKPFSQLRGRVYAGR